MAQLPEIFPLVVSIIVHNFIPSSIFAIFMQFPSLTARTKRKDQQSAGTENQNGMNFVDEFPTIRKVYDLFSSSATDAAEKFYGEFELANKKQKFEADSGAPFTFPFDHRFQEIEYSS